MADPLAESDAMRQASIAGLREVAVDLCTCGNARRQTPHTYMCPTRRVLKWLDRLLATLAADVGCRIVPDPAFRKHVSVGAYLPVGQLDGDCRECGVEWPCEPILSITSQECP